MSSKRVHPSAHDVARLAGVSQAAVSRAFNPGASISENTRSKVLTAAHTLGYRPNLLARSLITGKSRTIGVVIGSPRNPFYLEALDCLSDRLVAAGMHLLVFTARADRNADDLVESLLSFRVQSLLLMSATLSSTLAEHCKAAGIPVIFFSRRAKTLKGFASVTGDNHRGGREVAQHFFDRGYRRPAFMGGDGNSSTSQERSEGFCEQLRQLGLPEPDIAYGHYDRVGAQTAAHELLSRDMPPDSIFCANDMMALSTIETARYDFGLQIGRDLGVAGFDDIEGASWRSFDLTTYSQPPEMMIEKVTDVLFEPESYADAPHIVVEGELKTRGSTSRH